MSIRVMCSTLGVFERATEQLSSEFATVETFSETIRERAQSIAKGAPAAYRCGVTYLRQFHVRMASQVFDAASIAQGQVLIFENLKTIMRKKPDFFSWILKFRKDSEEKRSISRRSCSWRTNRKRNSEEDVRIS